jgi:hypothetical protein
LSERQGGHLGFALVEKSQAVPLLLGIFGLGKDRFQVRTDRERVAGKDARVVLAEAVAT